MKTAIEPKLLSATRRKRKGNLPAEPCCQCGELINPNDWQTNVMIRVAMGAPRVTGVVCNQCALDVNLIVERS